MNVATDAASPRSLRAAPARCPWWLWALLIVGGLLGFVLIGSAPLKMMSGHGDVDAGGAAAGGNYAQDLGIGFCAGAFLVAVLVLGLSLPIFLYSKDADRVKRAGGLVKTTLGFLVGSAGTILATISFKS